MDNYLEWITKRVEYIRQLKHPTKQQELLVILSSEDDLSADDEQMLKAVVRAEKAIIGADKAKADVTKRRNASARKADKQRTHELIQSGLLMVAAGLVDSTTGKPMINRAELVGALASMAKLPSHHDKRQLWRREGSEILAGYEGKTQSVNPSRVIESNVSTGVMPDSAHQQHRSAEAMV